MQAISGILVKNMPAQILDGKKIAERIKDSLKPRIEKLKKNRINPGFCAIMIGDNEASKIYIREKSKAAIELGIKMEKKIFEKSTTEELLEEIRKLNKDSSINGILVQLPLPENIQKEKILGSIKPEKDIDGFTPANIGLLAHNQNCIVSCTAKGIMKLIEETKTGLKGKRIAIIGNSILIGKPLFLLLSNKNATITICDEFTKNLGEATKNADILISAAGVPFLVKKEIVKENSIVIDAGITRQNEKINGDVDFENVSEKCSFITPVPGGVGPMTVACLMENIVEAAENQFQKKEKKIRII